MRKGFTLVELSIVLVIIGLLIGGILVAQSLIDSTRVKGMIGEYNQYNILANQYKSRFGYLPGDDPRASSNFGASNCPSSPTNDCSGDGNGNIGEGYSPHYSEACRFWEHMKWAGILESSAIDIWIRNGNGYCHTRTTPYSSYSKIARWGVGNLEGTAPFFMTQDGIYFWLHRENYLDTGNPPGGSYDYRSGFGGKGALKPVQAMEIDKKIDDGLPRTGDVIAGNDHNSSATYGYAPNVGLKIYCLGGANSYYLDYTEEEFGCQLAIKAEFY